MVIVLIYNEKTAFLLPKNDDECLGLKPNRCAPIEIGSHHTAFTHLEDVLNQRPRVRMTTGHQGGTISGSFLATADARTDVQNTLGLQFLVPPGRILMLGVAPVDDDVALLDQRKQLVDKIIDRTAGCG